MMRQNKFHLLKLNLVNAHGKTICSLQAKLDTLIEELKSTKNALDNALVLAETYRK